MDTAEAGGATRVHRHRLEIPVDVDGRPVTLRGWLVVPAEIGPDAVLLYCLAGGNCTTGYYDLEVDGADDYSMAAHLAARGLLVCSLDHPGIGASDPVPDLFTVTMGVAAAAHAEAHAVIVDRLRAGTVADDLPAIPGLVSIGVGHSMGGAMIDVVQARHRSFAAVAGLGHGRAGLPMVLSAEELAHVETGGGADGERLVELARIRFDGAPSRPRSERPVLPGVFHTDDVPAAARAGFAAQTTTLLYACGLASMMPGILDTDKATIDRPVFLALAEHDLVTDLVGSISAYRSCPDATLYLLPGSGHCHHTATTRHLLWDRLARWVRSITG